MLKVVPLEDILKASGGSVYKAVIIAAKRGLQIAEGEKPLLEKSTSRFLDDAIAEMSQGLIKLKEEKQQ